MSIQKFGYVLQIPPEFLIDCGIANDARMAAWKAERDAAQPGIRDALAALDALGGIEREVLDLHSRMGSECAGCDFGGYEGEPPMWPCRTVEFIAARNDVDLSNFHLYDPEGA